ncbi:MAG: tetratricopeptide repeat protein [Woeseiaceae bacterium]|nr:tetratricopeptide repeat protein [Woeseiaceae bacterium]
MGKHAKLSWSGLTAELGRREVYPVVVAYAIVAWLLLQIGEVTFTPLGLPEWVMTGLVVIVIAGFPVAVLLAWRYDITPSGIFLDGANVHALAEREYGPSVAVLPFIDLSPEQDQAYFCEGVAEEITNSLVKIRSLRVAARSSAFQYSSEAGDAREIGNELGVNTILEGSVRKSDGVVRITAQLVKVSDGCHLWSKTYDRQMEDVFAIQEEIASSIAVSLLDTISRRNRKAIRRPRSANVKAYDYYLRGRKHFKLLRRAEIEHAREMFRNAVDLDPEFSLAWAGYADCHSYLAMYVERNPDFIEQAHRASKRALQLGHGLAESHASRGLACLVSRDFDRAEEEFRKAIDINPYLPRTYHFYARERFQRGEMQAAAELFRRSADLDPLDYQSRCLRAQVLQGLGEIDLARQAAREAIPVVERHIETFPDDPSAFNLGALALIQVGEKEQALQWLEHALQVDPNDPIVLYNAACGFALLGKADTALDYLESALAHGTISLDWMRNDEDLSSIREDPRYAALEERLADG